MSNIIAIDSYQPQNKDKFFFDTNIWMYLCCPLGNYERTVIRKYDGFLKKALLVKSSIFVSSLVLSEFFNAYTRLEFNILKGKDPLRYQDLKRDFRRTNDYKRLTVNIKMTVKTRILKVSKRVDDNFSNMDLEELFDNIEQSDFNDNYYHILATIENMKIVTNDYDFGAVRKVSVPILTANNRLLKRKIIYS